MSLVRRVAQVTSALVLAVVLLPAWTDVRAADEKRSDNEALFSAAEYVERVSYLAGDTLEGRGTGQKGNDLAAEYIAGFFEKCGVQPAGDDGSFFQEFTLTLKDRVGEDTRLAVGTNGRKLRRPAVLNKDFVPFPFSRAGSFKGQVAFVGYGIVSEDQGYDDYRGVDVVNKVVLMFRDSPKFAEFDVEHDLFSRKASRANARDAAAILMVNPYGRDEGDALYPFGAHRDWGLDREQHGIPMVHIRRNVADEMLAAAGLPDLAALQQEIEESGRPASAPLGGVSSRVTWISTLCRRQSATWWA